ncbi:MAG: hypothetical protein ACTHN5_02325 [Phycisphaerae bacterium]
MPNENPIPPAARKSLFFAFLLLVAASLASIAWFACHRAAVYPEFAQAGDSFGYLQAAQDIRTGHAPHNLPRFTFDSPHSQLLHQFFQSQHSPQEKYATLLAPNAYHLFPQTNLIVDQYPPGIPLLLALFPQGHALHAAHLLTASLLLLFALAVFLLLAKTFRQGNLPLKCIAAALTALTVSLSLLMFAVSVSYATDFFTLPILPLFLAAHLSLTTQSKKLAYPLALAAGALLGFAILSHITTLLFLPGFLLLLWNPPPKPTKPTASTPRALTNPPAQNQSSTPPSAPPRFVIRHSSFVIPALFAGAFLLAGPLPLAIHYNALTGSPLRSTYTGIDTALPSLAVLPDNLAFYTTGIGSGYSLLTATALAAFLLLIASRRKSARPLLAATPLPNYLRALPAFILIPTAFFLTHPQTPDSDQYPTLLITLFTITFASLSIALPTTNKARRFQRCGPTDAPPATPPESASTPLFAPAPTLAATLLLSFTLPWYASLLPPTPTPDSVHAPVVNDPPILRNPNAWIFADRFSGTLWYYHQIPATELLFSDPTARWQAFQFINYRHDPIYILADNPATEPALQDLAARGATLTLAGTFAEQPIYQLHMP